MEDDAERAEENERFNRDFDAVVKKCVEQMGEHFDTVQVFVTRHPNDRVGTFGRAWASGNWYARVEQARLWVKNGEEQDMEETRIRVRENNQ